MVLLVAMIVVTGCGSPGGSNPAEKSNTNGVVAPISGASSPVTTPATSPVSGPSVSTTSPTAQTTGTTDVAVSITPPPVPTDQIPSTVAPVPQPTAIVGPVEPPQPQMSIQDWVNKLYCHIAELENTRNGGSWPRTAKYDMGVRGAEDKMLTTAQSLWKAVTRDRETMSQNRGLAEQVVWVLRATRRQLRSISALADERFDDVTTWPQSDSGYGLGKAVSSEKMTATSVATMLHESTPAIPVEQSGFYELVKATLDQFGAAEMATIEAIRLGEPFLAYSKAAHAVAKAEFYAWLLSELSGMPDFGDLPSELTTAVKAVTTAEPNGDQPRMERLREGARHHDEFAGAWVRSEIRRRTSEVIRLYLKGVPPPPPRG